MAQATAAMAIHPTAVVEDGALLGAGVEIGPFCIVGAKVRLGEGVRLLSHVVIGGQTDIGARTVVHSGAVLGGESQIRGNDAEGTRLVIGEDNVIREHVTFSLGSKKGHGVTTVGARGYFMAYSHIGHDCHVGDDVTFANGAQLGGHVDIADGVILGGLSAVQQFGRIGRGAMLGGVAGANEDIIPFGIAFGAHAKLAGLNIVGLKRRGIPRPNIHALRAAYRMIFLEPSGKFEDRVARARDTWPDIAEVREVIDFIQAPAKRPICRARMHGHEAAEEA
jgi:UDP-N-acetylglucosamine acyltransferase